MTSFRVALAQVSASREKRENLDRGLSLIREASADRADLLVLPEYFMATIPIETPAAEIASVAERVDGPFLKTLGDEARRRRVHVVVGILEKSAGSDKVYNTVVMVGPSGRVIAKHRKLQLYDSFGFKESSRFEAGDEVEGAFRTKLGVMGMMTCYELRFPEMARVLALQGAQLIIVPTAWLAGRLKEDHLRLLARARALENTVYVAVASQTGGPFTGRSVVVDPMGVPTVDAGEEETLVTAEIDLDRVRRVRKILPTLSQIRRDAYDSGRLRYRGAIHS